MGQTVQRDKRCNGMNGAMGQTVQWDERCNGTSSATGTSGATALALHQMNIAKPGPLQRKNIATRVATIHRSVATNVAMGVAMLGHREWRTKLLW